MEKDHNIMTENRLIHNLFVICAITLVCVIALVAGCQAIVETSRFETQTELTTCIHECRNIIDDKTESNCIGSCFEHNHIPNPVWDG